MNNTMVKRAVSLAAAFAMTLALLLSGMPVWAVGTLSAEAQAATGSIESGSSPTIQVNFTQEGWEWDSVPGNITITVNGSGGLSGNAVLTGSSISLDENKDILTYSAIIKPEHKFKYDGSSNAGLSFDVDYGNSVTASCVATVSVTKDPVDDGGDSGPVTPSTPTGNLIGIKAGTTLPEIKAGETKTLEIPLTNTSTNSRYAGKTQITATLPEGVYFNTATAMQELNFSRSGKTQTYKLSISADPEAKSGVFPITLTSVYKYSGQQVKEELQINLKVVGKTTAEETSGLSIQNYTLDQPSVKAGSGFKLTLTVKNTGNTTRENVKVLLDGLATDGITVNNGMDTQTIPSLAAGASVNLSWPLLASSEMVTGNHILTATASCGETTGSSKVFVPVDGKSADSDDGEGPKSSKPRVVIDSYSFATVDEAGEVSAESASSVEGGKTFRLTLNLKNTSTVTPIENLKMTISSVADDATGGVFTPANASNTFFIANVGANQTFTESIDLLVKADAPPKSYGLEVAVSYEAVLDNERVSIDDNETITIPVTQPDRFEVEEVSVWDVMFGDSVTPSVSYVNKGKSSIYNLSIRVEGTNFTTGESTSYVGNVDSGTGDYYEASLNPEAPGTVEGKFILTYEDAAGNQKEVERPFTVQVQEWNTEPDPGFEEPVGPIEPENTGLPTWAWILIGLGGAVIIAAGVIIVIKVRKKKAAKRLEEEDDYDD